MEEQKSFARVEESTSKASSVSSGKYTYGQANITSIKQIFYLTLTVSYKVLMFHNQNNTYTKLPQELRVHKDLMGPHFQEPNHTITGMIQRQKHWI